MTTPNPPGAAATPEHTAAFAARRHNAFYNRAWDGLTVAAIGLGAGRGAPEAGTEARRADALRRYLALGGNVIDTAGSHRERMVGATLAAALAAGEITREAVVVCTKGGYLSPDTDLPIDRLAGVRAALVDSGLVEPDEIADGHCMAPAFLRQQIAQSRANLQLDCLDLYYLHDPEVQLAAAPALFDERLRDAFATLEVAVAQGQLRAYGAATWAGLRALPGAPDYLSLRRLVETAREVAGEHHHFRAVQLPINFQMLEAARRHNQLGQDGLSPLLQVAAEHKVTVVASAPLLQSRVIGQVPERLRAVGPPGLTDAQQALQFVRSTPGLAVALAGMSRTQHVAENLALAALPPMTAEAWRAVFQV